MVAEGFEPSKRDASDLKSLPFDQTRERYQCIHDGDRTRNLQIRSLTRYPVAPHGLVHGVGFEPTKHKACDLESHPVDQTWVSMLKPTMKRDTFSP